MLPAQARLRSAVHTLKPSLHVPFVSKAYASPGQPHLICRTHLLFLPAKPLFSGLSLKSSLPHSHSHSMCFPLNCQLLGTPLQGQHRASQGTLSIIHQSVTQSRPDQNSSEGLTWKPWNRLDDQYGTVTPSSEHTLANDGVGEGAAGEVLGLRLCHFGFRAGKLLCL